MDTSPVRRLPLAIGAIGVMFLCAVLAWRVSPQATEAGRPAPAAPPSPARVELPASTTSIPAPAPVIRPAPPKPDDRAPHRKPTGKEVKSLVSSLKEAPVRDHPQARAEVIRVLMTNRNEALAVLRAEKLEGLAPEARKSINDAIASLSDRGE